MSKFTKNLRSIDASGKKTAMHHNFRAYVNTDCRHSLSKISSNTVNTIITSPPYGNLKNYGTKGEIGHGQSIENEYLPELEKILNELYRVSVKGGALWLILDMFRYKGKTVALPFELMERARRAGWQFQDMIVWDKGRNLPWSHSGRFRSVSEHILLFSKGSQLNHFNIDELRTTEGLSTYWVKYPERFHPEGKAPSDIWHIPIPTQGSWSGGNKAPHFCPFPIEQINRMITLTTLKNDLVMDPFCGTGSVLVSANSLGRFAIGFDINKKFFEDYKRRGSEVLEIEAERLQKQVSNVSNLRRTIIRLRANKYAASLFRELSKRQIDRDFASDEITCIIIKSLKIFHSPRKNLLASIGILIVTNGIQNKRLQKEIDFCTSRAPLSKFGLDPQVTIVNSDGAIDYLKGLPAHSKGPKNLYIYKRLRFNSFSKKLHVKSILESYDRHFGKQNESMPLIISFLNLEITAEK